MISLQYFSQIYKVLPHIKFDTEESYYFPQIQDTYQKLAELDKNFFKFDFLVENLWQSIVDQDSYFIIHCFHALIQELEKNQIIKQVSEKALYVLEQKFIQYSEKILFEKSEE